MVRPGGRELEDEADRKADKMPFHRLVEPEGLDAIEMSEVSVIRRNC